MEWDMQMVTRNAKLYGGLVSVTKPIRDQSELLQGDSYVTISNVYPAMRSIKTQLDSLEAHEDSTVANVARCVNKEFKRRVAKVIDPNSPDFDPIYAVATVLDPNNACLLDLGLKEEAETALLSMFRLVLSFSFAWSILFLRFMHLAVPIGGSSVLL
ncbi:unnamed protein product [Toxocara canis]|uniref:LOB domain-containing protein n=1 Tax=Toxocara canis TaxID=6265 RepID=A0A183VHJ5_TOXCA|nr:unnamed protein product [Toxocara canis]